MLEWTITMPHGPEEVHVRLKGEITERIELDELKPEGDQIVFIGDGVRYINSTGVKRLLEFLEYCAEHSTIYAERCSPTLVGQLNLVPRLAACVKVRSVIAPLECTECVAVADVLVAVEKGAGPPALPARRCEVCGGKMLLAELEERYFAFLSDD